MPDPKEVPLVVYVEGERKIVGKAFLNENTRMVDMLITDAELASSLSPIGSYSIFRHEDSIGDPLFEIEALQEPSSMFRKGEVMENQPPLHIRPHTHRVVQHRDGKEPWCNDCGLTARWSQPINEFKNATNYSDDYQEKAMQIVVDHYNENHKNPISGESVYIVWFSKTLQNWKALISTTLPDGRYYEVTYNGNNQESYLDEYEKVVNRIISD